ncbi:hypothetical protein P5V15_007159 [Pogonomyrmex californicus]
MRRAVNTTLHILEATISPIDTRWRDKILIDKALRCVIARDSTLGEKAAATAVWAAMKATISPIDTRWRDKILVDKALRCVIARDSTLGEKAAATASKGSDESQDQDRHGYKSEDEEKDKKETNTSDGETRRRVTDSAMGALGSLISGAASIAKAINDRKAARRQLEELQRYNRAMETRGLGLYFAPYKGERGVTAKKEKKKKKRQRDNKNTYGHNHHAIGSAGKAYVLHTVLQRCFYV